MSPPVDPSDPRVRQLAYSMYRDMLGACHGRSTDMVDRAPQGKQVVQDRGVAEQIRIMAHNKDIKKAYWTRAPGRKN